MMWFCWWAMANPLETTTMNGLRMPITPSEGHDTYFGVFEHPGAAQKVWTSDTPGFQCRPNGDLLEVVVERASWPVDVPEHVTCTADDRKKVKAKVEIVAKRHEAMFVPDGTLVMPRDPQTAAIFEGPPPFPDLIVQQGKAGSLGLRCEIRSGPVLRVIVEAETADGVGACSLRDSAGQVLRVPIKVVSAR
jgi:hypothetical protein